MPPQIDEQTIPNAYRSYSENQYGEQAIFLYEYWRERGTPYKGDAGWEHLFDVVDGKVPKLVLNRPEQMWLLACWEASGALKAMREQIREERRRGQLSHWKTMRRALKSLEGVRTAFHGTVAQFGMKSGYTGRYLPTLMLKDVMDSAGNLVTDHLWFLVGKQLAALHLQMGEGISFQARDTAYEKDDKDYREDVYKPIEIDPLPSNPTIITKIASASSSTALSTSSAETESGQGEVVEYLEASIAEKP